ncbi:MAG: SDR family NAD(P)-dependent oxidoreductase [Desulfobulbus sp.]|jgi:3-oxoacyl-[acyl-carrier protein] reductase
MQLLAGKTALITGAGRGIGAATAKLFAEHGAAVAVNYLSNAGTADAVVKEITAKGGRAIPVQADATKPEDIKRMAAQVTAELGPIDILVINAFFTFPMVPFLEYSWEDFSTKVGNELKSAFFCCQEIAPAMAERKSGSILILSSTLSRQAAPGFLAHSTGKSALDAFVKSLALELGPHGIRVNAVAPGLTETDATVDVPDESRNMQAQMTPLGRNARPEDVAGALLMLAGDQAGFITGIHMPVCGGFQMN